MRTSFSTALLLAAGFCHAYLPIPYNAPTNSSTPPLRKDINTLANEELTLFVLAMQQWQKVSASNVGSYFQVAGIHGAPHQYWDVGSGTVGTSSTGNKGVGYCFHGDENFYLWHRPYVALFEQQMIATAFNISQNWYQPQRAAYQAAASTLRLPYFDWAANSTVPATLANKQITITSPSSGQSTTINNPLYSYTLVSDGSLGKTSSGGSITVGPSRTTYRGSSYLSNMNSIASSLKTNTALLFNTASVCWNRFATTNTNEQSSCTGNTVNPLESIHNTVHATISGSMNNLDVAAFDPIFWLHHANVDRIGAIWNSIYPSVKVVATSSSGSTFVAGPGIRDDSFSYLPFHYDQGGADWWQPKQLYDVRALGYTYQEIADTPDPNTTLSRVNAIYGTGRTQQAISSSSSKTKRADTLALLEYRDSSPRLIDPPPASALAPYASVLIAGNGSFHEYSVACQIRKSVAVGTSFDLHLFFGDAPSSDYLSAPNRVGGFSVSQSSASMDTSVGGVVTITDALLNKLVAGEVQDLKPTTIRKYVRSKLVWRLVTVDGQDIGGQAKSHGLQIKVQHSVVTPAGANAQPIVAAPDDVADATDSSAA